MARFASGLLTADNLIGPNKDQDNFGVLKALDESARYRLEGGGVNRRFLWKSSKHESFEDKQHYSYAAEGRLH